MGRPYCRALRARVLSPSLSHLPAAEVGEGFGIDRSTVIKWRRRFRETGRIGRAGIGGTRKAVLEPWREWLEERVNGRPDVALAVLQAALPEKGVKMSDVSISGFLRRIGPSYKKTVYAGEQDRADIRRKRDRWMRWRGKLDPERPVFVDETWIKTNMAPLRGRSQRGRPLKAKVPHGHCKTMTFPAALRAGSVKAPCVFDRPINGLRFTAWVERFLVPVLKPGDIVIMDNLGSHKGKPVQRAIRDAGAHLLFPPPYSPDPNPIEMMFAKVKNAMRKAAERTREAVWRKVGEIIDTVSPHECGN